MLEETNYIREQAKIWSDDTERY